MIKICHNFDCQWLAAVGVIKRLQAPPLVPHHCALVV